MKFEFKSGGNTEPFIKILPQKGDHDQFGIALDPSRAEVMNCSVLDEVYDYMHTLCFESVYR